MAFSSSRFYRILRTQPYYTVSNKENNFYNGIETG